MRDKLVKLLATKEKEFKTDNAWNRQRIEGEMDMLNTVLKLLDLEGATNETSKGHC